MENGLSAEVKRYPIDITAIVTVADDGGSSGSLRTDFDVPPGDIQSFIALSEVEPLVKNYFSIVCGRQFGGHQQKLLLRLDNITEFTSI